MREGGERETDRQTGRQTKRWKEGETLDRGREGTRRQRDRGEGKRGGRRHTDTEGEI